MFSRFFLLCFLSFSIQSYSKIETHDSLDFLEKLIPKMNERDLVIFDIGGTLVTYKDQVFFDKKEVTTGNKRIQKGLIGKALCIMLKVKKQFELSDERFFRLVEKISYTAKKKLVDEKISLIIKEIQLKKIKAFAVTRIGGNKFCEEFWINTLLEMGIDFSKSFNEDQNLNLGIENNIRCIPTRQGVPSQISFNKGILFTDEHSKGNSIIRLMEKTNFIPNKIIYVDDSDMDIFPTNEDLERFGKEINKETEILSFKFTSIDRLSIDQCDGKIKDLQIKTLLEKEEWISDEEAQKILEKNKVLANSLSSFKPII
jgi:hypothetical protein